MGCGMKKSFVIPVLVLIFSVLFGCANSISERNEVVSAEFGSLVFQRSAARVSYAKLDVDSVSKAKISVSGSGISEEISVLCDVQNGAGFFRIEKIPVGKNRIITVQGLDSGGKEIEDAVLKAVVNIEPGENSIDTISRSSSIKGFIYSALLESGVDISSLADDQELSISRIIPTLDDCGSNLDRINYALLVEDFSGARLSSNVQDYLLPEIYLKRLSMAESVSSTAEKPSFCVTAVYSDGNKIDVTEKALWQVENSEILSVDSGVLALKKAGKTKLRAEYSDESSTRFSQYANVEVIFEEARNNFIYLDVSDSSAAGVNYAKDGAAVVAWIWGAGLSSCWYPFEKISDSSYIRLELPSGAEKMVVARGKELQYETSWNGLYKCWNQTEDLDAFNEIYSDGKKIAANTLKLNKWDGATGNWLYVDHGDSLVDSIYAKVAMEPSEDDTSLASVTVNGSSVLVSKRMFYTIPYDTETAELNAEPNYSGAEVSVSPSGAQQIEKGGSLEFSIIVRAKDGNSESYVVKVKRSAEEPLNSEANRKRCYVDSADEKTITIVYDLKTWGDTKENISTLTVRGSFTTVYNPAKKRWVEDEENFTLGYDPAYDWYSLVIPYEKISRPGFSGQPEYRFYKNGKQLKIPSFVEEKYQFKNSNNNMLILFESDLNDSARMENLLENSENASVVKAKTDFNLETEEDKHKISNFRQVPETANLYRSYHPFYPSHEQTPTEQLRLEQVQAYMEKFGIKSDINLCNNRAETEGMKYTVDGKDYKVTIPDYYKNIIKAGSVLYVGDKNCGGNGIVPSANFVYYYSDSELMLQWMKQICGFINSEQNQAPFLIHCEIGVDRTGVFCGILAALCGATWEEIKADYEKSCEMGIAEFRDSNILKYSLENMLKVSEITEIPDLQQAVQDYFVNSGSLSLDEISAMTKKLKVR